MMKTVHDLAQGSDAWHQFRAAHHGASEAAAMLGLSTKVKRNELLHMKKTGSAKEFSEWVQVNILDHGHMVEAMARPHAEALIDDDLYPATYSADLLPPFCSRQLSASCDGQTMEDSTAWEHKQWNEALAASVDAGILPDEHMPQSQQVLMVGGARRLIFTVSDGTPERMVHLEVLPDPAWQERIIAGWVQFERDLAEYEHIEVLPAAVAAPVKDLPALSIRVDGSLTLNHNLVLFGEKLQSFIEEIDMKPEDDQSFADCEAAIKVMERAEEALGAAEASALGQISTVDDMVRTVATYKELARKTRLMLKKMVDTRKESIRVEIQQAAKEKAAAHITALNARLGKQYMPAVAVDFAGVMKNKRTIASLRDAVDTELARFKIEANAIADKIQINLTTLRELGAAHVFLFADTAQIVLKASDDLTALVKLRIAEHDKAEAEKLAAMRARIAEEERIKAEAAATEKARLAQVAAANLEAENRARAEQVERERVATETKRQLEEKAAAAALERQAAETELRAAQATDGGAELSPAAQAINEAEGAQRFAASHPALQGKPLAAAWPLKPAPAPTTPPTLRLGQIGERLGFSLTADFLRTLGFEPAARDKAAVLYHDADFASICAALIRHIGLVQTQRAAA
jgi:predicted phage-related endonuclease